jgi:predicted nucleic acid-binding protein
MPVDEQIYLDTIALIKRYVPEQNSDRIDTYFAGQIEVAALAISRLTCVEFRSTLAGIIRENRQNSEL